MLTRTLGICLLFLAAEGLAQAEVTINGSAYSLFAGRQRAVDCRATPSCRIPLAEERLQLKLSASSEATVSSSFLATVDFVADQVEHATRVEAREIFADLTWRTWTARAGRQVLTWGIGDYLFVNDIFPKNYESFFLGRPTEYLKEPAAMLRILGSHVDAVVAPSFTPDVLPGTLRFSYSDPLPGDVPRTFALPSATLKNVETAIRLFTALGRWDLSLYGYRGFARSPSLEQGALSPDAPIAALAFRYPRLQTAGASLEGPVLGGLFGLEGAYFDSVEDRSGTNPFVDNSQVKALAAYTHPLWEDASVGVQAYAQIMSHHDAYVASLPPGFRATEEVQWTGTVRLSQLLLQQTLQLGVFAFVGLTERDAYLIPSARYAVTDNLSVDVVGNIFLGEDHTSYGRFARNTNVKVGLQYAF